MQVMGCDFSSSPSRRKPIVVAHGVFDGAAGSVQLQGFTRYENLSAWADWLAQPGAWTGGFDLPFGLPRELVAQLGWPQDWLACMQHYSALARPAIRQQFAAFCAARPVGGKFAHRQTDDPAGSSPSMKWVNPPVAYMLHAGVPLVLAAQIAMPGLRATGSNKVALEAYPGMLARQVLGRTSYKSDDKQRQTPEREQARAQLWQALNDGHTSLGLRLQASAGLRSAALADATGDHVDAVVCMLQAAWGLRARLAGDTRYGLPADMNPLEGWIVTAPPQVP